MNRARRQALLMQTLSPDVARFVWQALWRLEKENIFDAPGVISGVRRQMLLADSNMVRREADRVEGLLKLAFSQERQLSIGA